MVDDQPKWRTGKICYIEIPAAEVARSAEFYQRAFGWRMRTRGDGATSFDDSVGQVSGTFVTGRPPATEPGFGIYIMVADVRAALEAIAAAGGKTMHLGQAGGEDFAMFSDPAGNILGIYQQPGLAEAEEKEEENQHG
jgi:predicted enzyme related to lactoylglutathione lyase